MTEHPIPLATKAVMLGCGALLQSIGVDAGPIFWAFVGASFGMSFARPSPRFRAVVVFLSVTLACSLFGSWLALTYLDDAVTSRNAAACALAILFHPLINLAIERLPRLADAAIERVFGPPGGKP